MVHNARMQAVVYEQYGAPEVLQLREVERPTVGDRQVLVRVHATSVNAGDMLMLSAPWLAIRLYWGLFAPRNHVLGFELSGTVEAVGAKVTRLRPGDEVFGGCESGGAWAQFIATAEKGLVLKPSSLTHAEAAACPVGALTALTGLVDKGRLRAGQRVLINGASGSVGSFAVQLAKSFDTEVTAVCRGSKHEFVRSLGADQVIDYREHDFTQLDARYDLVFDAVGDRPIADCKRTLTPEGIYVAVSGRPSRSLRVALFGGKRATSFVAFANREGLERVRDLIETGKLKPAINRRFALSETPEAMRYVIDGHARGKVVITVS